MPPFSPGRLPLAVALAAGIGLAGHPALARDARHEHQLWHCHGGDSGQWQCQQRTTLAAHPQATVPKRTSPTTTRTAAAATPAAVVAIDNEWHWVPLAQLDDAERCRVETGCKGAYRQPPMDWPDARNPREQSPLRAEADRSEAVAERVELEGSVQLTRGDLRIHADHARYTRDTGLAHLTGNVRLYEPGLMLRGDEAEVDTRSGLGEVRQARVLDFDSGARAEARLLRRDSPSVITLEHASYTQCTPDDEVWSLRARRVTLNEESGRGSSRHTVLRLGRMPVFYSPYLNFPIDDRRLTGFLWPSMSSNSSGGFDITAPLYLNLAPNYDATLAPRWIADRGSMLEAEVRHLSRFGQIELAGGYLPDDNEADETRWLGSVQQRGSPGRGISTRIDYTKVSDNDYFRDLNVESLGVRREVHLNQQALVQHVGSQWRSRLEVQQYQTIDDLVGQPYRKLPQVTLERRGTEHNFRPDLTLLTEYTHFDHDDAIRSGGNRVTGERYYAETGVGFPMRWTWGFLQPAVQLRHVSYDLDDPVPGNSERSPGTTLPMFTLDTGLFFERDTSILGRALQQTLEPRLFYVRADYEDQNDQPRFDTSPLTFSYQQLFHPRRFSGHDRLEDFNQLSFGATSRFIDPVSGRELFAASLGQILYFEDRRVRPVTGPELERLDRVSTSEVAGELRWQPTEQIWGTVNLLWDSRRDYINEGGLQLNIEGPRNALYNVGYRFRRSQPGINALGEDLKQLDLSTVLPVGERWALFARFNYDLAENRRLEDLFGFQYEDCCWLARVAYQRGIDGEELLQGGERELNREHTVVFEFQLKGLGGLGSRVRNMLEDSIWGYRDRD